VCTALPIYRRAETRPPAKKHPAGQPADRERLHTRAIDINGYHRADGLYDIEAHLTDIKSFGQTNYERGYIEAGHPVHDTRQRLPVDETMHIRALEEGLGRPVLTANQVALCEALRGLGTISKIIQYGSIVTNSGPIR